MVKAESVNKDQKTRQTIYLALLTTFAIVLHTIEAAVPSPLPWVKVGLANIVTLVTISVFGGRAALAVTTLRVVVGSIITGTFLGPSFIISLSAGIIGTLAMAAAYRLPGNYITLVGVSVIGAYAHSLTQVFVVYILLVRHVEIFYILPFFLAISLLVGIATGVAAILLEKRLLRMVQMNGCADYAAKPEDQRAYD